MTPWRNCHSLTRSCSWCSPEAASQPELCRIRHTTKQSPKQQSQALTKSHVPRGSHLEASLRLAPSSREPYDPVQATSTRCPRQSLRNFRGFNWHGQGVDEPGVGSDSRQRHAYRVLLRALARGPSDHAVDGQLGDASGQHDHGAGEPEWSVAVLGQRPWRVRQLSRRCPQVML